MTRRRTQCAWLVTLSLTFLVALVATYDKGGAQDLALADLSLQRGVEGGSRSSATMLPEPVPWELSVRKAGEVATSASKQRSNEFEREF